MLTANRLIQLGFVRMLYKEQHEYYQRGQFILAPFLAGWLFGHSLEDLMVSKASYITTEAELIRLMRGN